MCGICGIFDRSGAPIHEDTLIAMRDIMVTRGPDAAGKYIVFIGHGASERINPDGAITGLPYLYGYLMRPPVPGEKEILAYLQGQQMLAQTNVQNEWVTMWGIFEVPAGTTTVRFFLNQALRAGVPHNGSAARFDHLGLYLFATRKEAQTFVRQYQ